MAREMQENERSVFALNGVVGMLIATALLLSILAYLSVNAVSIQHEEATNTYDLQADKLKMISSENDQYSIENQ
jgi:hypothetical protein